MYKFTFFPLWDQYTDSIVALAYVPVWLFAWDLSSLFFTSCNQHVVKCGDYIVSGQIPVYHLPFVAKISVFHMPIIAYWWVLFTI